MINRRRFLHRSGASLAGGGLSIAGAAGAAAEAGYTMPDEGHAHRRTWMAFGASAAIWGEARLPEVRRNLAAIAKAIARYEPVSMLVRQEEQALARRLVGDAVELVVAPLDDLWMRDTGCVFVADGQARRAAIDFNFNGWGEKQDFGRDAQVAAFMARRAGVPRIRSRLVLEGGGIEVDGQGTALITESCVLNDNRNPGVSKAACEAELKRLLGLQKIIWLPGIKGRDITDGHTDFYARFARPGLVVAGYEPDASQFDHVVTRRHLEILRAATDAGGRKLELAVLEAPSRIRKTGDVDGFAAGYVNFYVCNRAVIMPEFGDAKADRAAQNQLRAAFADRAIVALDIDGIAAGGGGIHCTTQQEPA